MVGLIGEGQSKKVSIKVSIIPSINLQSILSISVNQSSIKGQSGWGPWESSGNEGVPRGARRAPRGAHAHGACAQSDWRKFRESKPAITDWSIT